MYVAIILLTASEMIGASSGRGWYVKNFAEYSLYLQW
jgi:ABC-type nitrate/sulfonate/bicarbonate transport system permease component